MFVHKIDCNKTYKKIKKEGKWFSLYLYGYKISYAYVIYQYHKNGILMLLLYGIEPVIITDSDAVKSEYELYQEKLKNNN